MPSRTRHRCIRVLLLAVVAVVVGGCTIRRPHPTNFDVVETPESFTAQGGEAVYDRWWERFEDERLNAYVDQALGDNLDLAQLWQRILEARALARREAAAFVPEVDAGADVDLGQRYGLDLSRLQLGFAAAYEVDLFDRIHSAVSAERLRACATWFDYQTGAITLVAEVATAFYQLREAELQLDVLDQQIADNEKIRELIAARVPTQQLRGVDLLRQRELIEATREQRIVVVAQKRLVENQLAVLLGRAPGVNWQVPEEDGVDLPALPPPPDTGIPIELVRRRPDILAARYQVCAADKDLAVAIADRYPRLNLGAAFTTAESVGEDLFSAYIASFAAGVLGPVFDGGRRRAEVTRQQSIRERVLLAYGQAVLTSFREVEDALAREEGQRDRLASLRKQAALAEEATDRLRRDYFNGVGNYLDVLASLTAQQRLERDIVTNRRLLLDARIALYRALAGGFETPREQKAG